MDQDQMNKALLEGIAYIQCIKESQIGSDFSLGKNYIVKYNDKTTEWEVFTNNNSKFVFSTLTEIFIEYNPPNCGYSFKIISQEEYKGTLDDNISSSAIPLFCYNSFSGNFITDKTYYAEYNESDGCWSINRESGDKLYNKESETLKEFLVYLSKAAQFTTLTDFVVQRNKDYYLKCIKSNHENFEANRYYTLKYDIETSNWNLLKYINYNDPRAVLLSPKADFTFVSKEEVDEFMASPTSQQYFLDEISKNIDDYLKQEKNTIIDRINESKERAEIRKGQYITLINEIDKLKEKLNTPDSSVTLRKKLIEEISKIQAHSKVTDVTFTRSNIQIETEDLYIFEPQTERRYLLGRMIINIPFDSKNEPTYKNRTTTRKGFSLDMHHPHIWQNGIACYGNVGAQIVTYLAEHELYALFITALNFLQTCDIYDDAGWWVSSWDEVNENNVIIECGHEPRDGEYGEGIGLCPSNDEDDEDDEDRVWCEACGTAVYMGDDAIYCEDCDSWFCDEHATYYDELSRYICDSCAEEYEKCDDCGCLIPDDSGMSVENDNVVCDTCAENYICCEICEQYCHKDNMCCEKDEDICQNCFDESYVRCSSCDEYILKDDAVISDNGDTMCESCIEIENERGTYDE